MYEPIKAWLGQVLSGGSAEAGAAAPPPALLHKMLSGVISGGLASAVCNPTDVVKVRMQADGMNAVAGSKPRYRGVLHAFSDIYTNEGFRGLYKGVSPTVQRAAVVASVELASYDECKELLVKHLNMPPTGVSTHFAASIMAGFLVTIASSPLDVIKSRVMNQPVDSNGRGVRYSSTIDCFRKSVAAEGVLSLWKGFWPNFGELQAHAQAQAQARGHTPDKCPLSHFACTDRFLPLSRSLAPCCAGRLGPHCVVTFMVIEQLRNAFNASPKKA